MARRRAGSVARADHHDKIVAEYRRRLTEPVAPRDALLWPPTIIGPTWQRAEDGLHWLLPRWSIGWDVLGWTGQWLQHGARKPWRFTLEQARFVLWWYAVDEEGVFVFRDGVLERLKGWGKDPVGATLLSTEAFGPCRFGGWRGKGKNRAPVAVDCPDAWVQTAAVSLEQTKNTMRLFPSLFTPEAKIAYRIQVGKELVHGLNDERLIQAVTSSPATLEGARATFVLRNETHHWLSTNEGHDMDAVIDRNATKSPDGAARALSITNSYNPSEDSVAQRAHEAFEAIEQGRSLASGILYDSLEAPPDAPLTKDDAPDVLVGVRGDSIWLNIPRIVKGILDPRNSPSSSRRFWYNQKVAAEDAWAAPHEWDALEAVDVKLEPTDEIAMFFDGSKTEDATGLAGCRLSDGHVFTIAMWQRPQRVAEWSVPRDDVDAMVAHAFASWKVAAFFCDPGAGQDDSGERYWDDRIDTWARLYGKQLRLHAVPRGEKAHACLWDMRRTSHQEMFTYECERTLSEMKEGAFTHDGDKRMRTHVHNARRRPNGWGISIGKEHRESSRKIDLAVCMIGARLARRELLAGKGEKPRSGIVVAV